MKESGSGEFCATPTPGEMNNGGGGDGNDDGHPEGAPSSTAQGAGRPADEAGSFPDRTDDLRAAVRRQLRLNHPDKGGDVTRFQELQQ